LANSGYPKWQRTHHRRLCPAHQKNRPLGYWLSVGQIRHESTSEMLATHDVLSRRTGHPATEPRRDYKQGKRQRLLSLVFMSLSSPLRHNLTAVNKEQVSGDIPCVLRSQEHDGTPHVLWCLQSLQWGTGFDKLRK